MQNANTIKNKDLRAKFVLFLGVLFCLTPLASSASALLVGVIVTLVFENPIAHQTKQISQKLLSYSIIGLGAGMNLIEVGKAGLNGLTLTAISITLTVLIGLLIGRWFKCDHETSILVSVGTAICGGSAIAAVGPAIRAKSQSMTVALGIVFILNALALVIFPQIGQFMNLSQEQFGYWIALAIHDTSSVVGAGLQYGSEALKLGTTIKLARALWIVPLTFAFSFYCSKTEENKGSTKKPWFILGFLFFAALFTWTPQLKPISSYIEFLARKGFILTLYFIGTGLSLETLKSVGWRPFFHGLVLWLLVTNLSLLGVFSFL